MYFVMYRNSKYLNSEILYTGSWDMCESYIKMRPTKDLVIMPS